MDKDKKFLVTKNNHNIILWFSIIFIGVMLFLAHLILQTIFAKKDHSLNRNIEINKQIPIEMRYLPGFTLNQKDDSMKIEFFIPDGMVEDEDTAKRSGLHKLYRSADNKKVNPESVIAISFLKKKNRGFDLRKFVLTNTLNLIKAFPNQKPVIGLLTLQPDVVKKFEYIGIPYQGISYFIAGTVNHSAISCAIFYFETPDGFWSINWTAPKRLLERETRERNIFLGLIKFMMIGINNPNTKSYEIHM